MSGVRGKYGIKKHKFSERTNCAFSLIEIKAIGLDGGYCYPACYCDFNRK